MTLHTGKRPARPYTSAHIPMGDLLKAVPAGTLPPVPKNFGHGYAFGQAGWKMLGNGPCDDGTIPESWYCSGGAGNCFWAGLDHSVMEDAKDAGRPVPEFTCLTALDDYAAYLDLASAQALTAQNDQGTDMQDALQRAQTVGVHDTAGTAYTVGQTVSLDVERIQSGDLTELWAGAYLFEQALIGVNLQAAQESAFPGLWEYVADSQVIGGHCVVIPGNNGYLSWGQRGPWALSFVEKLMDEGYCFIDPERYSAVTGETAEYFTNADLEKYVALVAQSKS